MPENTRKQATEQCSNLWCLKYIVNTERVQRREQKREGMKSHRKEKKNEKVAKNSVINCKHIEID